VTTATTGTDLSRATQLFHALSDETRLAVVEMLHDGERCVCDLQDALDVAQSRLSFHLKVLKDAGLVTDRKEGRWVHYALNSAALAELMTIAGDLKPSRRVLAVRGGRTCCD
jgi:ArsR family transcriptional regulator, arsenate/arsenite/antimonite-responsive transcriptional repressor